MNSVSIVENKDSINLEVTPNQLAKIALLLECVDVDDPDLGPYSMLCAIDVFLAENYGINYEDQKVIYTNEADGVIEESDIDPFIISFEEKQD